MDWTLHFLEAEGTLAPWRERLAAEACQTHDRLATLLAPDLGMPRIDMLIQRLPGQAIPELGMGGHSYRRGCMSITLDPDNQAFAASLGDGQFSRLLTHEVHHCMRYDALGYGETLGEALVSEGLADQFDCEAHTKPGQPWTDALTRAQWPDVLARMEPNLSTNIYSFTDHAAWFYGRLGDKPIPRWSGYSVGFHLVGAYLAANPQTRASRMAGTPVEEVLADAWPRLKTTKGALPRPFSNPMSQTSRLPRPVCQQ